VLVLLLAAAVGCGGSSSSSEPPPIEDAQSFVDDFVNRLIVDGRYSAVEGDVAPLLRMQVRRFQQNMKKDHVNKVLGPGKLHHDCPKNQTAGVGVDCYVFRLQGRQVVPIVGVKLINGRYRVWVVWDEDENAWQVANYDYLVQQ
jgi:hypothetical protein